MKIEAFHSEPLQGCFLTCNLFSAGCAHKCLKPENSYNLFAHAAVSVLTTGVGKSFDKKNVQVFVCFHCPTFLPVQRCFASFSFHCVAPLFRAGTKVKKLPSALAKPFLGLKPKAESLPFYPRSEERGNRERKFFNHMTSSCSGSVLCIQPFSEAFCATNNLPNTCGRDTSV